MIKLMVQTEAFFFLCFFLISAVVGSWCVSAAVLPMRMGNRYIVGGTNGWKMPPPASLDMYARWAAGIRFYVADSIEFVYKNDSVVKVDKFGYYHCNVTAAAANDGSVLFLLDEPGFAYFSSADVTHCKKGQRLMINVEAVPSPARAPATSPIAIAPAAAAPSPSPSPSPSPAQEAAMTSAAASSSSSAAHALLLAVSATALAMMGLILGEC